MTRQWNRCARTLTILIASAGVASAQSWAIESVSGGIVSSESGLFYCPTFQDFLFGNCDNNSLSTNVVQGGWNDAQQGVVLDGVLYDYAWTAETAVSHGPSGSALSASAYALLAIRGVGTGALTLRFEAVTLDDTEITAYEMFSAGSTARLLGAIGLSADSAPNGAGVEIEWDYFASLTYGSGDGEVYGGFGVRPDGDPSVTPLFENAITLEGVTEQEGAGFVTLDPDETLWVGRASVLDLVATSSVGPDLDDLAGGVYQGTITLRLVTDEPCPADLAEPFGLLDLADINAFVAGFVSENAIADLDGNGLFDLQDINAFVGAFLAGCP